MWVWYNDLLLIPYSLVLGTGVTETKCVNENKLRLVHLLQWNLCYIIETPIKRTLRPVRTYPFSFENATFSLRTRLFRPQVSIDNDHWNRNFSKMLFRVELFENALFVCACGRIDENGTFRNADVTESIISTPLQAIFSTYQFKIMDRCFTLLPLTLGLISNVIIFFQAN